MALTKQQELYVAWFALNDKDVAIAKQNKWYKMSAEGKVFYLRERVLEKAQPGSSPYKIILGYCADGGRLRCRMWYYSGSEASWRAFTGFRDNGSWTKGSEYEKKEPVRTYTLIGYVNECFVTFEMHQSLQLFWNQQECTNIYENSCPWDDPIKAESTLNEDRQVFEYMAGLPGKGDPCEIGKIYNAERKFTPANLPSSVKPETEALIKKTGSVAIQYKYGVQKGKQTGLAHKLKEDTVLQNWINSCLANQISSVQQKHPVLNDNYTIWSYTLNGNAAGSDCKDDLVVEIAASDSLTPHTYIDYSRTQQHVDTPYCWVRNVYYPKSPTSSFGTRTSIPCNLSFLVQKPCDYDSQISPSYLKVGDPSLIGGKYRDLSMLNEATSPLLRAFKDKNHYPRFREKYHKAKKPHTAPPALPIPAGAEGLELGDRAYFIKRLITMGINEYLSIQFKEIASSYSTSGHHGKAGLHRANALSDEIQKCPDDSQKVSKIMFDCFAKNRVGKFTGGIFSKIRTEPTSLFTCICRYLMTPFVIADPGTTAVTAPVPIHWSKLTLSPGLKGPEHSIDRMAYYIHSETITAGESESLYITKKAPQLLTALKG